MPTPKTRLMATAISATCTVKISECVTSGSFSAERMPVSPWAKVFFATKPVGHATSRKR